MAFTTKLNLNDTKFIQADGVNLTLSGDTKIPSVGTIAYVVQPTLSGLQLANAAFVTGCTAALGSVVTGATNGLTKTGKKISLGGALTGNTCIGIPADVSLRYFMAGNGACSITSGTKIYVGTSCDPSQNACNMIVAAANSCRGHSGVIVCPQLNNGVYSEFVNCNGCCRTTTLGLNALIYGADYRASYTDRSLVDRAYICTVSGATSSAAASAACAYAHAEDAIVSGATLSCANAFTNACTLACTITASNGLCKTAQNITLGGVLTQSTVLDGSQLFGINATTVNVSGSSSVNLGGGGQVFLKTVPSGTGTLLCRNASTGQVELTSLSAFGGITGGTNGLSVCPNDKLGLGGTLCNSDTVINGKKLTLGDLCGVCVTTSGTTDVVINAKSNGAIILKSQSGVVNTDADFTNAVGMVADFNGTCGLIVYNCRVNPEGMSYAGDYSLNYSARSLVDKQYVDSVATGLNIHAAAIAGTTGPITLSGNQVIDGVTTTTGMRILVKDQVSGATNGIYSASTGAWGRTSDYHTSVQVTNGDLIPITSGSTQNSSIWALTTLNPITVGVTPLIYTEFSTVVDVQAGAGIAITQVGGVHTVCTKLGTNSSAGCGLAVTSNGLCIDSGIGGNGLSFTGNILNVNAANCGSVGAIPVGYNVGDCLVVAESNIRTAVSAISGATNGLTNTNHCVCLGGALNQATTITIASDTCKLTFTDTAATKCGIIYGGDYSSSFIGNSLVSKTYVTGYTACASAIALEAITGVTNGLTKIGTHNACLGGNVTTSVSVTPVAAATVTVGTSSNKFVAGTGSTTMYNQTGNEVNEVVVNSTQVSLNTLDAVANKFAYQTLCGTAPSICTRVANATCDVILCQQPNSLVISSISATFAGAQYAANYCANYSLRSLVDKAYVTGLTSAITTVAISGATNGLGVVDNKVCLGGLLLNNTTINLGTNTLFLTCGSIVTCGAGSTGYDTYNNYKISGSTVLRMPKDATNIAVGNCALRVNSTGIHNTAVGYQSLYYNLQGQQNTAMGYQALYNNTGGTGNIGIGECALFCNTVTTRNIGIGAAALAAAVFGTDNIAIGSYAMCNAAGPTSICASRLNVAIGYQSLMSATCGCMNIAIGECTLRPNTCGSFNVAIGETTLPANTIGCWNTAIGAGALTSNVSGMRNVAVGAQAGYSATGSDKLYIGNCSICTLIYGDFANKCVVVDNFKVSGATSFIGTPADGVITDSVLVWDSSDKIVKKVVGSSLGDHNNNYSKTIVTINTILTTGSTYVILVNSPATARTITLPTTPIDGQAFKIKDAGNNALTNNITIDRNGNFIDGAAANATINTDGGALELMYDLSLTSWEVLSFVN